MSRRRDALGDGGRAGGALRKGAPRATGQDEAANGKPRRHSGISGRQTADSRQVARTFQPIAALPAPPAEAASTRRGGSLPVPWREAAAQLGEDPELWQQASRLFPIRWPEEYLRLAAGPGGEPIARMGAPHADELRPQPGELADPVGEDGLAPVPFVVRKHDDRVILLVTATCHFYCRFCFRRSFPGGDHRGPSRPELDAAIAHLAGEPAVREIILSGGDPLTLSDERLQAILAACAAIPHVERLRIHSRAPVHEPTRVTPGLAHGLVAACAGKPLRLVTHPNHAVELTPAVADAMATLQESGIEVLSQSVLLAGVNDGPGDLAALFRAVAALGVTPCYLHHPDRVAGAARFFVSLPRGLELFEAAARAVPAEALPAYVIDVPDGSGKIAVSSLVRVGERRFRAPSGFEWEDVAPDADAAGPGA